ncbi:uncharacterized protein LOC124893299, partial [Capsicum annuum]|uniref:uncharacterized protein LOC124893299 n=1 Tax=Capsicum annuum TaxID=4072 RepID=UPI001FB0F9EE
MITNNVKLQNVEIVALTKDCSSVVIQKMPKKLKDPGSFTLLIQIGNNEVTRSSSMILQLEDWNLAHPEGIIEDILIKVDERVLVILGRPFFATRGALINIREGMLTIRLDDKEAVFKV